MGRSVGHRPRRTQDSDRRPDTSNDVRRTGAGAERRRVRSLVRIRRREHRPGSYGYPNTHPNANPDAHADPNLHANPNADSDADANSYLHAQSNSDADPHTHAHAGLLCHYETGGSEGGDRAGARVRLLRARRRPARTGADELPRHRFQPEQRQGCCRSRNLRCRCSWLRRRERCGHAPGVLLVVVRLHLDESRTASCGNARHSRRVPAREQRCSDHERDRVADLLR